MPLPNYKDGSIVNLMSSIEKALGSKPVYKPLKYLGPKELSKSKNIVLMVIDGLGYEYLIKYGKGSVFNKNLKAKITSVFPSTTSTAILTFVTGVAPQQHAITGWVMYLREIGAVSVPLRFMYRAGGNISEKVDAKQIYDQKPFFNKIKAKSFIVAAADIVNSSASKATIGKEVKKFGYNSLTGFFTQTKKAILFNNKKKFIYSYWPDFDSPYCHEYGNKSKKTYAHFKELDKKLAAFLKSIKGTNTTVIITADHGLIDVGKSNTLVLDDHPKLKETLALPLCGEPRVAYCYVKPSKIKQFENYVRKNLRKYCELHKSEDLIKKNYFGLFKPHKKLLDRIGDYVLIMKKITLLKSLFLAEKSIF